ncbi:hypothetical protein ESY86_06255 [Subsaximicrobium wynnwilliamsii]|uniref:Uncharacterized protein n=1 Tax=Subsaximicrobium wynnwilliamsii TaxID=291179 RepID=A0A5C6ZKE2_9FLAO|nr:hypothetical protein [Subsaximicrobium wynnwilliamsii]TXD84183.1 hypothetical protein ESY87_06670 [Subsaximicrobium wynnwilliamsii]TXD89804.1 hypothetical protein ESY86_06255 [Subsaximicrobium wynnwilliamsii]TXE03895.1 hypothetical protein ESY88_06665 [Subsaximicrobium wynnwilliamsii]
MQDFLINNDEFFTKFFELAAAVSGSIYLNKTKHKTIRIFVYYLWLTVVVETLGVYTQILQNNYDYEWYIALKNSVFCPNTWLYNIYSFLAIGLIGIFYSGLLSSKKFKIIIRGSIVAYSLFTIVFFLQTNAFFVMSLPYNMLLGTMIICVFVVLYFLELIRSEVLLKFYKLPSFYISVALLFWYLCVAPLFIFGSYYRAVNTDFIQFRVLLLLIINILTYSCFSFGFIYSLYKNK